MGDDHALPCQNYVEKKGQAPVIGPRRLDMKITSHRLRRRNTSQLVEDRGIVQVTGVQDEIHTVQPLKQRWGQRRHTVRHVRVR